MRVSAAVGTLAMVFVLPEDIGLTSGSPRYHRNFLDIHLSQFSKPYLSDLLEFQKVLKQRNALLKKLKNEQGRVPAKQIDTWDEALLAPALRIMQARSEFIGEIGTHVGEISSEISAGIEKVEISYLPRLPADAVTRLRSERGRDIRAGTTTLGPHRDTIEITISGRPLRQFGSMGQKKSALLAMKLAALNSLSRHREEPAILVLDEAFAALDVERSRNLMKLLAGIGQVFLASASEATAEIGHDIRVFEVESGKVKERA
jgi:DNA replication and repair protein RecF